VNARERAAGTGAAAEAGDRVAVISGGSKGLGRLLVERLLVDGWRVATFSRSANEFVKELQVTAEDRFLWEAADRICGKRLKAVLPQQVGDVASHVAHEIVGGQGHHPRADAPALEAGNAARDGEENVISH